MFFCIALQFFIHKSMIIMKYFLPILIIITFSFESIRAAEWRVVDSIIYSNIPGVPALSNMMEAIDCCDSLNCVVVSNMTWKYPWNRKTTDGGMTWNTTLRDTLINYWDSSGNYIGTYTPAKVNEVDYPSADFCIAICDTGYCHISRDSCKSWERIQLDTKSHLKNVSFVNSRIGAVCSWSNLFLTIDGGLSWKTADFIFPDSIPNVSFQDIKVLNDKDIYCLIYSSELKQSFFAKSTDFGESWTYHYCGELTTRKIFFLNKNVGWLAGGPQTAEGSPAYRSTIYHTEDGGKNWELQLDTLAESSKKLGLRQIYFSDENNGIAMSRFFTIYRTTNGGKEWFFDDSFEDYDTFDDFFWDIAFFGPEKIYALPENSIYIYKYANYFPSGAEDSIREIIPSCVISGTIIHPNPITAGKTATYSFELLQTGTISMELYDIRGRRILKWPVRIFTEGFYSIELNDVKSLNSGEYFLKVSFNDILQSTENIIVSK